MPIEKLSGPFGHYSGLALIFGGVAIILLATVRFVRITRRLDDVKEYSAASVRAELFLAAGLVFVVVSYGAYLALG